MRTSPFEARTGLLGVLLALAAFAGSASAQATDRGATPIDNLRQPPGTETAALGSLGHVERRGDGDVHLLLVPGAGFGWRVWEDFMDRNADRYTMWAVTPPGYDGTPPPPMPESVDVTDRVWSDALVEALGRLIDAEGMHAPVIIGHHLMGDYYAMRVALENPESVGGLVVVGGIPSRPDYRTEDGRRRLATEEERAQTVREQLMPMMRHATREVFVENSFPGAFLSRDEELGAELQRRMLSNPIPTQVRYALEWATANLAPRLGDLDVPMLAVQPLVWESFDEFIVDWEDLLRRQHGEDADLREAVLEQFGTWEAFRDEQSGLNRWRDLPVPPPAMDLAIVERSAQFVMHDRPDEFDRVLAAWIDRAIAD